MDINLEALINPELDIGVPGGMELLAFCDAVLGRDRDHLNHVRRLLHDSLGPKAVVAAAAIAASFSKNDRVANGCGIPSELWMLRNSKDIRHALGLNSYRSAANTKKYYPDEM